MSVDRLVEQAREQVEADYDDLDVSIDPVDAMRLLAGLADAVEQHTDCVDRVSWDKLAVERHDVAVERDEARARVAALEAAIAEHRERIESDGLAGSLPSKKLWDVLDLVPSTGQETT